MGTSTRPAVTVRSVLILPALGIALGAATAAANHGLGPSSEYTSRIIGREWAWLSAGFLACWAGRSWSGATARGLILLLPAVLAHAVLDRVLQTRPEHISSAGPGGIVPDALFWSLLGVLTAAGLAVLVALIQRGGDLAVLAGAALPALITYRARDTHSRPAGEDPVLHEVSGAIWPITAVISAAILIVGFVRLAYRGRPRDGIDPDDI